MSTLYEGWVLEHSQDPHHHGELDPATHQARCDNPLCGDRVTVQLRVHGDRIEQVRFRARACAVATASSSVMTDLVQDLPTQAARALAQRAISGVDPRNPPPERPLGHLSVVRDVRSRRRCATLPWEALVQALDAKEEA